MRAYAGEALDGPAPRREPRTGMDADEAAGHQTVSGRELLPLAAFAVEDRQLERRIAGWGTEEFHQQQKPRDLGARLGPDHEVAIVHRHRKRYARTKTGHVTRAEARHDRIRQFTGPVHLDRQVE